MLMWLKGHYYCNEMLRSVFLPGDRYFLFNLPYCGNYNGKLLIDAVPRSINVSLKTPRLPHTEYRYYSVLRTTVASDVAWGAVRRNLTSPSPVALPVHFLKKSAAVSTTPTFSATAADPLV